MSMVMELIAAVTAAERQIDEQMMRLRTYSEEINRVTERVSADFSGSQKNYGTTMLAQLSTTKQKVDQTIERLQIAKDKLQRVRMI